mmetsp:Transcript_7740/g.15147  ORF Transcript_7740/g.15147 Transcript_7740/m.15147 type:complete len:203 (-) Transcript_7740:369-977(-)
MIARINMHPPSYFSIHRSLTVKTDSIFDGHFALPIIITDLGFDAADCTIRDQGVVASADVIAAINLSVGMTHGSLAVGSCQAAVISHHIIIPRIHTRMIPPPTHRHCNPAFHVLRLAPNTLCISGDVATIHPPQTRGRMTNVFGSSARGICHRRRRRRPLPSVWTPFPSPPSSSRFPMPPLPSPLSSPPPFPIHRPRRHLPA